MASTSLSQTASTPTSQHTGTLSFWMKLGNIGVSNEKLYHTTGGSDSNTFTLQFQGTSDRLMIANNGGILLMLNRLLRDTSAYYHIVCVSDPSNATASQRLRIYINGVEETSMATDNRSSVGTSSVGISVNSQIRYISGNGSQDYFDGYMADYYFIDGQALSPTDFGQTDSTGIWKPKGYSGTYGTNGFYLKFSNSGDLGADSSGNGNNFTKSGNGRQRTDTPSNVFAIANPLMKSTSDVVLSDGNLKVVSNYASGWQQSGTTFAVKTGKWYWEAKATVVSATDKTSIGVVQFDTTQVDFVGTTNTDRSAYGLSGHGAGIGGYTYAQGDIIMCAMDITNNTVYWGKNGTWYGTLDPETGTGSTKQTVDNSNYCMPIVGGYGGSTWELNFGNPTFTISSGNTDDNGYGNFEYAPPTGYLALCTNNLATEAAPTIDDGSAYFQAHCIIREHV